MTLPAIEVGQIWRRSDGTEVEVEIVTGSFGFYAGGSYYSGAEYDERYVGASFNRSLDLVELCHPRPVARQPLEEVYQEGLEAFGDGEPADSSSTAFPPLTAGQWWQRRDGVQVEITGVPGWLEADGFIYHEELADGDHYEATSCPESFDLIEYLGDQEPITAPFTPQVNASRPRRLESFGYSDGVFYGLAEDGTAWLLREHDLVWIQFPSLPN